MTSEIYEAYVEAYMKVNKCSRDVALASIKQIMDSFEKEQQDD